MGHRIIRLLLDCYLVFLDGICITICLLIGISEFVMCLRICRLQPHRLAQRRNRFAIPIEVVITPTKIVESDWTVRPEPDTLLVLFDCIRVLLGVVEIDVAKT